MKLIIFLRFTKKERNNSSVLLIFEFTDLFTSLATDFPAQVLSKHDKKQATSSSVTQRSNICTPFHHNSLKEQIEIEFL